MWVLENNWPEVIRKFQIAWKKWASESWVLVREGVDARTPGIFYTAVVQDVLLYGLEVWVMSTWIGKTLGVFHHRVICKLTGKMP